jgi:hypothetical protein
MATQVLSRQIQSRRGLVRWIGPTVPANPAHGGQTLLKCCEPAIRGTAAVLPKIVIGTSRIVLRLCGSFGADYSDQNSQYEQRKPHGDLLMTLRRGELRLMSRSCRGYCAYQRIAPVRPLVVRTGCKSPAQRKRIVNCGRALCRRL